MLLFDISKIPTPFEIYKYLSQNFTWLVILVGILAVIIIVLNIIKFTKFTRNLVHAIFNEKLFFILLAIGLIILAIVLKKYEII